MYTDAELRKLFSKLERIAIASSNGGNPRDKIWFKIDGQPLQGICTQQIVKGECIAFLADNGEWYLRNTSPAQLPQSNGRNLQYKITKPIQKSIDYQVPILFYTQEEPDNYLLTYTKKHLVITLPEGATIPPFATCEISINRLYFQVPKDSTVELEISPDRWYRTPYVVNDFGGGSGVRFGYPFLDASASPPTPPSGSIPVFKYNAILVKYTSPQGNIGYRYAGFLRTGYNVANSASYTGLGFAPAFIIPGVWDGDASEFYDCVAGVSSHTFTKNPPSFPESAKKYKYFKFYLGGDRPEPLDLGLQFFAVAPIGITETFPRTIDSSNNGYTYDEFIEFGAGIYFSALDTRRFVTARFVKNSAVRKIILKECDGDEVKSEELIPGSQPTINQDDWRKSLQNFVLSLPSSGDRCIDSFRFSTSINLDTESSRAYAWAINTEALNNSIDDEIIIYRYEAGNNSCSTDEEGTARAFINKIPSDTQIHSAAPIDGIASF